MDNALPQPQSLEEQELKELREKWSRYPKLSKWFDLYFDTTNVKTFHKRTEAALIAYELDPTNPADRKSAWELGSRNARKIKEFAVKYLEQQGWTKEKVLELIAAKAVSSNNAKFSLMLAELTDTYEEKPKVSIQNNVQINNANVQVEPGVVEQRKRDFADFINEKFKGPNAPDPAVASTTTGH